MRLLRRLFDRSGRDRHAEFMRRWGELTDYNTLRAKGVLFDPNVIVRMREVQREYNEWIAAR